MPFCDSKPPQNNFLQIFGQGGKKNTGTLRCLWGTSSSSSCSRGEANKRVVATVCRKKHGDVVIDRVHEMKSVNAACNDHCTMLHCCSFDPPVNPRRVWRKWVLLLLLLLL
jgi:hypothetical protein